jgi:hypothetical protein
MRFRINNTYGLGFLFSVGRGGIQVKTSWGLLVLMAVFIAFGFIIA